MGLYLRGLKWLGSAFLFCCHALTLLVLPSTCPQCAFSLRHSPILHALISFGVLQMVEWQCLGVEYIGTLQYALWPLKVTPGIGLIQNMRIQLPVSGLAENTWKFALKISHCFWLMLMMAVIIRMVFHHRADFSEHVSVASPHCSGLPHQPHHLSL